jgi:mannose-6-phosphate isomerase-like protein (cupin superfamily)
MATPEAAATVVPAGEGKVVPREGGQPIPMVKMFGEDTGGAFALVEVMIPTETDGPLRHLHRSHDESFYVLEGTISFQAGYDELEAGPGTYVFVPRGVSHTFENRSAEPARMLGIFTPGIERMLLDLADASGPQEMVAIAGRYDTEFS